jgi:hypothetical protein
VLRFVLAAPCPKGDTEIPVSSNLDVNTNIIYYNIREREMQNIICVFRMQKYTIYHSRAKVGFLIISYYFC